MITKKTVILTSDAGLVGMATFTRVSKKVELRVSVSAPSGYKLVVRSKKDYEFDVFASRSSFLLPEFDFDDVSVGVFIDGKLFCKGGKDFEREDNSEEFEIVEKNERKESKDAQEEREKIAYMDDAIATENYYPSDVVIMSVDDKPKAVMISARIDEFIENKSVGLFDYNLKKEKSSDENKIEKDELKIEDNEFVAVNAQDGNFVAEKFTQSAPKLEKKGKRSSVFIKKPFDYDEIASTVYPMESISFSRKAYYYEEVKDKIDALFKRGEREKSLESLMPDTRWVRVEYSSTSFYVVGIIGSGKSIPDYICYGVPSPYSAQPPISLGKDARWAPCDVKNPQGDGYWLLFQSAKTGETIKSD